MKTYSDAGFPAQHMWMTTAIEIIPRNVPFVLHFIVSQVQSFASSNNKRLSPVKCKVLAVDFILQYNSFQCPPIATGGYILEEVKSFKFLGIYISHDLTWEVHCASIVKIITTSMLLDSSDVAVSLLKTLLKSIARLSDQHLNTPV